MVVSISSWYLETVLSILEEGEFAYRYEVEGQEGSTVTLKFDDDRLLGDMHSWLDAAKTCELIFRGSVSVL